MKRTVFIFTVAIVEISALIASTSLSRADPPSKSYTYAVIKPLSASWDTISKFGCERNSIVAPKDAKQFSFVRCGSQFDAFKVDEINGWQIQKVDQYQKLSNSNSLSIAISAFIDPAAVRQTEVRWFYPAVGTTPAEKASWLLSIGSKLEVSGIDSSFTSKINGNDYTSIVHGTELAAFDSNSISTIVDGAAVGSESIGISFPIQDLDKISSKLDFGLTGGTKIVSFDKDSTAQR
jgi:hypothetical protein